MTSYADRQFLWDWAQLRKEGRKNYAERRAAIAAAFAVWGGVNMAVRMPTTPTLLFGTLVAAAALAALVYFASGNAFTTNDKRFTALTQSGAPIPDASPRKTMPRNAVMIGIAVAAIIPIIAPTILRLFLK